VRPRWVPSDFSIIESFNGRIHPDALGLLLYAIHGTKVSTGTGAAKNHVFTPGDPFPIILRDRWSTTALKSFIKYRCMLTGLSFSGDRLDDLVWTCDYVYTNQEMNVAHTSTTLGDVADMLMVSNITGKVTVFSLTPAGGSLIDLTAKGTKINWGVTRNATPSKAPIAVAPITGLPVPSAVTEYNLSLDYNYGFSDPSNPDTQLIAIARGAANGTLPSGIGDSIESTIALEILGGETTETGKFFNFKFEGKALLSPTYDPDTASGTVDLQVTDCTLLSVQNETADYAVPT